MAAVELGEVRAGSADELDLGRRRAQRARQRVPQVRLGDVRAAREHAQSDDASRRAVRDRVDASRGPRRDPRRRCARRAAACPPRRPRVGGRRPLRRPRVELDEDRGDAVGATAPTRASVPRRRHGSGTGRGSQHDVGHRRPVATSETGAGADPGDRSGPRRSAVNATDCAITAPGSMRTGNGSESGVLYVLYDASVQLRWSSISKTSPVKSARAATPSCVHASEPMSIAGWCGATASGNVVRRSSPDGSHDERLARERRRVQHDEAQPVGQELGVGGRLERHRDPVGLGRDGEDGRESAPNPRIASRRRHPPSNRSDRLDRRRHGVPVAIRGPRGCSAQRAAVEREVGHLVAAQLEPPRPSSTSTGSGRRRPTRSSSAASSGVVTAPTSRRRRRTWSRSRTRSRRSRGTP